MMAGGRLHRCSFSFMCRCVLLLQVGLHGIETSSCQTPIHKKVGDAVQLSPCSLPEGVVTATWKYGEQMIADIDEKINEKQFKDRLNLNRMNFTLTVSNLTIQDSGRFSFISAGRNNQQRPTDIITLQVHEPITNKPVLTSNSTWHPLNDSCTIFLDCDATTYRNVSYLWAVGNQTLHGPRLRYIIRPQDGDIEFSCTVDNVITSMSESTTVKCSNETRESSANTAVLLSAAGGVCVILVAGIVICVCHCKRCHTGLDSDDATEQAAIYEDVFEVKTCKVNEKTDNTPRLEMVYDKIQLSRIKENKDVI
ncbi:SLAM family member 5 isoform X2 [Antennarius striatus]|uniref:SLAM family member 5 isoform X2 n=1 Tax=Antennarius striatus TaxID=241820 RepID=UPI0035B1FA26